MPWRPIYSSQSAHDPPTFTCVLFQRSRGKVAWLGVVLALCFLVWRSGRLPMEIRIRHDRRQIQERRWNTGGLLSPRPPRLDGQGVEVERHRHRRALEIGIHPDEEVWVSAVWTLFSENTTLRNCPPARHLSIPAANHDSTPIDPVSAGDVWAKLEQAVAQRYNCPTENCCQVSAELG